MRLLPTAALAALVLLSADLAAQQGDREPARGFASRDALQTLLERMEGYAESPAYSAVLRSRAEADAARLRGRLADGDFQVGDRIFLTVEREEMLTDTFTVNTGPEITLPDIGPVSLAGVLRAELQDQLLTQVARYIRDPVVRAQSLVRVFVSGGVGSPGFYTLSSEMLLSDALASAGQPSADAKLEDIRIERDGQTLWEGRVLQEAIVAGRTLDQLGIRAGDQIVVPESSGGLAGLGGLETPLRALSILIALPATIFGLTRIF